MNNVQQRSGAEKRNLYWRVGNNGGGNHGAAPSHLSLMIGVLPNHVAIIVSCCYQQRGNIEWLGSIITRWLWPTDGVGGISLDRWFGPSLEEETGIHGSPGTLIRGPRTGMCRLHLAAAFLASNYTLEVLPPWQMAIRMVFRHF